MSIEDDLRSALAAEADRGPEPADAWDEIQEGVETETRRRRVRTAAASGLAAAAVIALVLLATPVLRGDDTTIVDSGVAGPGTTEATDPPATTEPAPDGFVGIWPFTTSSALDVYPDTAGVDGFHGDPSVDYTDPEATALDFAATYLGFPDPVLDGGFQQGANRIGEVVVRPRDGSPMTTLVGVRRLGTGEAWSVLFARSNSIDLNPPSGRGTPDLEAVSSPVSVAGEATAFEGTIQIEVREDGMAHGESLGEGFATGGTMGEMAHFSADIAFDPPTEPGGALVLTTVSMEDGSVQEATVAAIRFAPGSDTPPTTTTTPPPPTTPPADGPCEVPEGRQPGEGEMAVTVFYTCYDAAAESYPVPVVGVERIVPETPGVLQASIDALLHGPTPAERDAGVTSFFSEASGELLLGVSLQGDRAVVDFDPALPATVPNASTSAGGASFLAELNTTVFQFSTVDEIEYRIDGSCEDFGEWMQSGRCHVFDRSD